VGGDEFLILLPEVGELDQADQVARKLLAAMAREAFTVDKRSFALALSVGIAFYPDHGSDIDELMTNADRALYDAKRAGKNQFAHFTPRGGAL
jgi:diguanylate cyclase (GGDEF)-like protein